MVDKTNDLTRAREQFAALVEEIRTKPGLTDEERAQKIRTAVVACPPAIAQPALRGKVLAERIKRQYGLDKARKATRDDLGRFAVAAGDATTPPSPTVSSGDNEQPASLFTHRGAVLPPLRT